MTARKYSTIDPGFGEHEAQHAHMELEFPGPMPNERGISVTDYTLVDAHGNKYGVINSAFNALEQKHIWTVRLVIGTVDDPIRGFGVEGVRLHLQWTNFFNSEHRDPRLDDAKRRLPLQNLVDGNRIFVDNAADDGRDRVLPVKFIVGDADKHLTTLDLHIWFYLTGFFDTFGRNCEIDAQVERVLPQHSDFLRREVRIANYVAGLDSDNAFR